MLPSRQAIEQAHFVCPSVEPPRLESTLDAVNGFLSADFQIMQRPWAICVLQAVEIRVFSAFWKCYVDSSVGRALTHFGSRRWKARRSNQTSDSVCIASDSLLMRRNDYPPNGAIHVNTAVKTRCTAAVVPPAWTLSARSRWPNHNSGCGWMS